MRSAWQPGMLAVRFEHRPALPGATCDVSAPSAGEELTVSRTDLEQLTDHGAGPGPLLGQLPIGIDDQGNGFQQIRARFVERGALRIDAGQLLNEADLPLGHFAKDGRELKVHHAMIRLGRHGARRRFMRQSVRFAATAAISNLPVFSRIFRCPFLALC